MLLHAANNASLLGVVDYAQFNLLNNVVIWLLAIVLVLATGGTLSWNKGQRERQPMQKPALGVPSATEEGVLR